jgi:beta-N-acetylhexosaminidase
MQQEYQRTQGLPLFLAVDEEGGRVRRIGKNENFQVKSVGAMGTLAQAGDTEVIFDEADTIGAYLSELGFTVDFAPDADVLTNENNEVIGDRSFGTDPKLVSQMAARYSDGLHNNGLLSCYKHYPGHGGTVEDSHTGAAYSYKTLEELYEAELVPFMDAEENGADFVMVAHICVPAVIEEETVSTESQESETDIPATFSKRLVTDLLRNELGYQGIIVTDSLSMGAITEYYDENEAAVYALEAGCDMLLMPKNFKGAYEAVLTAVQEGRLTEERLEESVYRIIKKKLWLEKET